MSDHELSRAQALAIEHASGPMQVLAGPGSGKTFVTIRRIRHLIRHHGISPKHILVITYTKAAAAEMKERFHLLMDGSCPQVNFGTFHAVFFHILQQVKPHNRIASTKDKMSCIRHAIRMTGVTEEPDRVILLDLLKDISAVKNGSEISSNTQDNKPDIYEHFPSLYREYCHIMEQENILDFDDMIVLCARMFDDHKEILQYWQEQFPYIMIDEFQDISPLQYKIVRQLAEPFHNLFVVGDDDQAIYGFRGAGPGIMKQFREDYQDAVYAYLDSNYRCSEAVVQAAQVIISDNKERFDKQIKPVSTGGSHVKITAFLSQEEEYRYLAEALSARSEEELLRSAAIFRTNAQALLFAGQLSRKQIPYCIKERGQNLLEHPAVQDIITYQSFASDSFAKNDEGKGKRQDFFKIMNKPIRYIHREAAASAYVSQKDLLSYYSNNPYMQETIRKLYVQLQRIKDLSPYISFDYIRKSIGLESCYLAGKRYEEQSRIKEILNTVQKMAADFASLQDWLTYCGDYSETRKALTNKDDPQKGIQLITMHASKGLEYDSVYLPDVSSGIVPNKKAEQPHQLEEERRLLYVAVTRAKKYLEILYHGEPSPFLTKLLKSDCVDKCMH